MYLALHDNIYYTRLHFVLHRIIEYKYYTLSYLLYLIFRNLNPAKFFVYLLKTKNKQIINLILFSHIDDLKTK